MGAPANSVEQYVASFPEPMQSKLRAVRKAIRAAIPDAVESISYGMAAYKLGGRPVVYFGGFKDHYSFFGGTSELRQMFKAELAPYAGGKGTIQFPLDAAVPAALIRKIALQRAADVQVAGPNKPPRGNPKKSAARNAPGKPRARRA